MTNDRPASPTDAFVLRLDLRHIAPPMHRRMVFRAFDGLAVGSELIVVADDDPRPACVELRRRCPGAYNAQVIEAGPITWTVRIAKAAECVDGEGGAVG